jgi:hypothetical protein
MSLIVPYIPHEVYGNSTWKKFHATDHEFAMRSAGAMGAIVYAIMDADVNIRTIRLANTTWTKRT